jgi:transcriptional regulator with XRE-family HTH domain
VGPEGQPLSRPAVTARRRATAPDQVPTPDIGSLVKALRKQRGYSLTHVAEASGLSTSFLSAVERGKSDISVQRLARVAAVFNHDLGSLLGYSAGRTTPQLIDGDDRIRVDRGEGISYEAFRIPGSAIEMFVARLAPRSSFEASLTHAGIDVCFVVEGELVLEFDGSDYPLKEGDCITWPGSHPHLMRNRSDKAARLVAFTTETIY